MLGRVDNVRVRSVGVAVRYGYEYEAMRLAFSRRIPHERERRVCEGMLAVVSL